jgi:hypothetical protein
MMRKLTASIVAVLMVAVANMAFGQADTLHWFVTAQIEQPNNPGSYIPGSTLEAVGAMWQLIRTTTAPGGTPSAPVYSGNGLTGGDTLLRYGWCGSNSEDPAEGNIDNQVTFASLSLNLTDRIYMRIWDRPSSGSGNLPTPFDYGSGNVGAYYYDVQVQLANAAGGTGNIYDYVIPSTGSIGANDWTFLASAVPEPGTMVLGLLGLGLVIGRRLIRRK